MTNRILRTALKYAAVYAITGVIGVGFMLWKAYRDGRQAPEVVAEPNDAAEPAELDLATAA